MMGILNTTPMTWTGVQVTSAQMNAQIRDALTNLQSSWTTGWTPTMTGQTTNPTIGNSTLTGRYHRWGKTVVGRIDLTVGSTFVNGTGVYTWALPTAAVGSDFILGSVMLLDASPQTWYIGTVYAFSTTLCSMVFHSQSASLTGTGNPIVLANGDKLRANLMYEAA